MPNVVRPDEFFPHKMLKKLDDKIGVPAGLPVQDVPEQFEGRILPSDVLGDEPRDVAPLERQERYFGDVPVRGERSDGFADGAGKVLHGRADRADQEDVVRFPRLGDLPDQLKRRLVRPLDVVDAEEQDGETPGRSG